MSLRVKVRNAGALAIEPAARFVSGFAVIVVIARSLGAEEFGIYSFVLTALAMAQPFVRLGLDGIILREASRWQDGITGVIASAMLLRAVGGVVSAGVLVIFMASVSNIISIPDEAFFWPVAALMFVWADTLFAVLKARERVVFAGMVRVVIVVASGLAIVAAAILKASVGVFVAIKCLEIIVLALSSLIVSAAVMRDSKVVGVPSVNACRALLVKGFPLALYAITNVIYARSDQVMLAAMSTPTELGHYGLAVRMVEMSLVVPTVLQGALFAAITRNHDVAPANFSQYFQRIFDLFTLAGYGCAIGISVSVFFFAVPVFGGEYGPAVPMVILLCLSIPFTFQRLALGNALTVQGSIWIGVGVSVFIGVINIGLNLLLIPHWGGSGAAFATVVSLGVGGLGATALIPSMRLVAVGMSKALDPFHSAQRLVHLYLPLGQS